MEKKNPFSDASKNRRMLLNQRNSEFTQSKKLSRAEKRLKKKATGFSGSSSNYSLIPKEINE
ncbi:MAG: hypothetical protein PHY04_00050 [Candidatus ainarchaeum sp.]|nr:hypothetical protein [Candidatus ainarchaeum sp.]MDD3085541.1 hypothetical protein [Candidatus ainarchaeum sp.]MDD4128114.1 hypothetical protein [Candidatus ainarchaeum sp.]MDD4467529.1 hypothetical protein [Candidatus ainarchaeum sp.]HPM85630.1 hypothetical protein [archaeon]